MRPDRAEMPPRERVLSCLGRTFATSVQTVAQECGLGTEEVRAQLETLEQEELAARTSSRDRDWWILAREKEKRP